MPLVALSRDVSPSLARCELAHLERVPIYPGRASRQHAAYLEALQRLGCRIHPVSPAPEHPDAVFVEDTAIVLDEVAIITRPGAASRRGELDGVAAVVSSYRPIRYVEAPGTVDGGDVLRLGRTLFVGASARTDAHGAGQLRRFLEPLGYEIRRVPVNGCLHLKTAATTPADGTILLNPDWVDRDPFRDCRVLEVDPREPFAANVLRVGDVVLMPDAFPRTRRRLEAHGVQVETVDVSELAKAEGGVTCCSVLLAQTP